MMATTLSYLRHDGLFVPCLGSANSITTVAYLNISMGDRIGVGAKPELAQCIY